MFFTADESSVKGLYDPRYEHDACGIGFVANIRGAKSHQIIEMGLKILLNLRHRGACGCDAETGDGAGLLIQMPNDFMRTAAASAGVFLPAAGDYGTGLVFLPRDPAARKACIETLEQIVRDEQQLLLGWRDVPVNSKAIGDVARRNEPSIRQIFIGRGPKIRDVMQFERKLFVIRKFAERTIREMGIDPGRTFYIPSLSHRTFLYKGLLLAEQVSE